MVRRVVNCGLKPDWSFVSVRIIHTFLVFFKISGLLTPSIEISSKQINDDRFLVAFKPSKFGVVYNSLLLTTWLVSYTLVTTAVYFNRSTTPSEHIFENVFLQQIIISVLTCFTILLRNCTRQRLAARIGNDLTRLQMALDRLRRESRRKSILGRLVTIVFLHLLLFALLPATDYYAQRRDVNAILRNAPDIVAIFLTGWCALQYYLVVAYVDARLADANDALSGTIVARGHRVDEPALRHASGPSLVARVIRFRDLYKRLYDLANSVDEFYSPMMIFVVANISFRLMTSLFFTVVYYVKAFDGSYMYLTREVVLCLCISLAAVLLAFSTTSVKNRARQTASIVHVALNNTNDKEVIAELELFSLQLLHGKPQFTACRFFNLDCSLLQAIIHSVTTYMVILIQFQIALAK